MFGSCATGLALKSSDVDIAISGFDMLEGPQISGILQVVLEKLQCFKWVTSAKPIYTAAIPVLKLVNFGKFAILLIFYGFLGNKPAHKIFRIIKQ